MSKVAPDFSGSFELVQDQLVETEQRLRRQKSESDRDSATETPDNKMSHSICETSFGQNGPSTVPTATARKPEPRRNLTLKVLESNEARFNCLFHQLQLAGDHRRKQDLADEALQLLFAAYREYLSTVEKPFFATD